MRKDYVHRAKMAYARSLARSKPTAAASLAALLSLCVWPASAAVPPALGPAATVQQADTPSFSVSVLRGLVEGMAQQVVTNTNASLQAQGQSTRVSLHSVTAWSPRRVATQFVDRPNQFIVQSPFMVKIKVEIPWASDRTIAIPIDIQVSCEGWWRSAGQLRFVSVPGPASIEGGNLFEEIIGIRDVITARVRNGFTPPSASELPFSGACATVGVFLGGNGDTSFDAIIWSPPLIVKPTALKQRIEVTPLSLRRLVARAPDTNQPIGNAVENILFESYANFHLRQTPALSMRENDQVVLNLPAMVLYGEPTTSLVVIGNTRDTVYRTTSTSFRVSSQAANYSPGTHTLQLMTDYWMPPTPPLRKPYKISIPTYELTYYVSYTPPWTYNYPVIGTFGVRNN